MNRRNRKRRALWRGRATLLGATALLCASPALASEGEIVLFPTIESLPRLIALMVIFIALIFPLNALLFRPIFAALDAREQKIAGTRARAEKLNAEAREVLERYQGSVRTAREAADQQRREELLTAKSAAGEQLSGARADAEGEIERARGEIARELASARASLRAEADELAREATSRILGRNIS